MTYVTIVADRYLNLICVFTEFQILPEKMFLRVVRAHKTAVVGCAYRVWKLEREGWSELNHDYDSDGAQCCSWASDSLFQTLKDRLIQALLGLTQIIADVAVSL
jgi:hypothetical protein